MSAFRGRSFVIGRNVHASLSRCSFSITALSFRCCAFGLTLIFGDNGTVCRCVLIVRKKYVSLVWAISQRNVVNGKYLPRKRPDVFQENLRGARVRFVRHRLCSFPELQVPSQPWYNVMDTHTAGLICLRTSYLTEIRLESTRLQFPKFGFVARFL